MPLDTLGVSVFPYLKQKSQFRGCNKSNLYLTSHFRTGGNGLVGSSAHKSVKASMLQKSKYKNIQI